jgi:hypothetical protein
VQRVESSQRAEGDTGVRVYGVPPEDGASPREIVRGFLEAMTSDEADFATAREYLTPRRRADWDPFGGTTVLAAGPQLQPSETDEAAGGDGTQSVELGGTRLALVDESHVYQAQEGDYRATIGLRAVDGEWRIDVLPDGLLMGEADFSRIYRPVNTYYFANLGVDAGRVADGRNVLVADPVYVRRRIEPVRDAVRSVLDGPSDWVAPAVSTAVPEGVVLAGPEPEIYGSGTLAVRLDGVPATWTDQSCERMAAQLLHTVREVAVEVRAVALEADGGRALCELTEPESRSQAPGLLVGDGAHTYFLDAEGSLVSSASVAAGDDADAAAPRPVPGPLGDGTVMLRDAAVSREEDRAAGVSADGSTLYVAPLTAGDAPPETPYAGGSSGEDAGLSTPSWDGLGDLWVADRDPADPRLLRLTGGTGEAHEVPVEGLADDERITALRIASDGVRIALLVDDGEHTTLRLGRVRRTPDGGADGRDGGEDGGAAVAVEGLRQVAPQLESVTAVSWAGGSRLVVVGQPVDGVQQLLYVETDGSTANRPAVPGLNDITGVAASEAESLPLLAQTAGGVALLRDDQWGVVKDVSHPFYPG